MIRKHKNLPVSDQYRGYLEPESFYGLFWRENLESKLGDQKPVLYHFVFWIPIGITQFKPSHNITHYLHSLPTDGSTPPALDFDMSTK
mgnify:CR=1 FL=1